MTTRAERQAVTVEHARVLKEFWTVKACLDRQGSGPTSAAVLCPGPSLRETWQPLHRRYAVTLAVNTAILFSRTDWLVSHDEGPLVGGRKPRLGIVTKKDRVADIHAGRIEIPGGIEGVEIVTSDDVLPHHDDCVGPRQWTRLSAIAFAAYLGCTEIDVYGDDRSGDVYWDGTPMNRNGTNPQLAKRWTREGEKSAQLMAFLDERGVRVVNALSEGAHLVPPPLPMARGGVAA